MSHRPSILPKYKSSRHASAAAAGSVVPHRSRRRLEADSAAHPAAPPAETGTASDPAESSPAAMKREPLVEPPPPSARMIDFLLRQQQAEPPQQNQPQQQLHSSTNPLMKSCDDKSNGASIIHGQMSGDTPDTDGQRALAASDQHRQELLRLQQAIHQRQREIAEQSADRPSSRVFKLRAHLTRLEGANKKLAHQLVGSVKEQNRLARRASKAREEASAIDRETRDIHAAMEQLKQKHKELNQASIARGDASPIAAPMLKQLRELALRATEAADQLVHTQGKARDTICYIQSSARPEVLQRGCDHCRQPLLTPELLRELNK